MYKGHRKEEKFCFYIFFSWGPGEIKLNVEKVLNFLNFAQHNTTQYKKKSKQTNKQKQNKTKTNQKTKNKKAKQKTKFYMKTKYIWDHRNM